jgi:hypothetical protein
VLAKKTARPGVEARCAGPGESIMAFPAHHAFYFAFGFFFAGRLDWDVFSIFFAPSAFLARRWFRGVVLGIASYLNLKSGLPFTRTCGTARLRFLSSALGLWRPGACASQSPRHAVVASLASLNFARAAFKARKRASMSSRMEAS